MSFDGLKEVLGASSPDHVLADMAEKIDKKSVDLIVHNKYEDIVEYLQQALHADEEDGEEDEECSRPV